MDLIFEIIRRMCDVRGVEELWRWLRYIDGTYHHMPTLGQFSSMDSSFHNHKPRV